MPTTTPQVKIDAVQALGGEVVLAGGFTDAYQHSLKLQQRQGLTFVHPFDDSDVTKTVLSGLRQNYRPQSFSHKEEAVTLWLCARAPFKSSQSRAAVLAFIVSQ